MVSGGIEAAIVALQHQVDLLDSFRPVFINLASIHQDIHIDTEIPLGEAVGGEALLVGNDADFRITGFKRRHRAYLRIWNLLTDGTVKRSGGTDDTFYLLAGNVYLNGPSLADIVFENTDLQRDPENAGDGVDDPGKEWNQFPGAGFMFREAAEQGEAVGADKKTSP